MYDAMLMRVGERVRHLAYDSHRIANGKLALALEPALERFAGDERHDVVEQSFLEAGSDYRQAARMLKMRSHLGLALDASGTSLAGDIRRQQLHDHLTVQRVVDRQEPPAHPAARELPLHGVTVGEGGL